MNLAFQEKLSKHLSDNLDKSFLNLGTCSLHPVHTAFHGGITSMSFNLDQFFTDIHKCSTGRLLKSPLFNGHFRSICYLTCGNKVDVNETSGSCCWTEGQSRRIFSEISSQSKRCLQKNHENCKVPEDSWTTWGFNNFGICVILCFYSHPELWNASVTISIRQAYDTSFTSRNAIIAMKSDDEIYTSEVVDSGINSSQIVYCLSKQQEKT